MGVSNGRPSIEDVGREAGVSQTSVSFVLSGSKHAERISPDTKRRILEAAHRLGYSRNAIGTALQRGYSDTVVLLVTTWHVAVGHSPASMPISRAASAKGLATIVHVAADDDEAVAFLMNLRSLHPYGLLLLWEMPDAPPERLLELHEEGLPIVDMNPPGSEGFARVTADRKHGFLLAGKHLIESGHTRIGILLHGPGWPTARQKQDGYAAALESAGIQMDESLLVGVSRYDLELNAGYDGLNKLLARRPDATAVLCPSDQMALGALAAAHDRGLSVPGDLSIVGYGGSQEGAFFRPSLTTVVPQTISMAERAVDMLMQMRTQTDYSPVSIYEPMELVVRDSTGPAPAGRT